MDTVSRSIAVAFWCLFTGFALFGLLRGANLLRVPEDHETLGLNVSEYDAKTVWLDTMRTMQAVVQTGDLSLRAPVEIGTEAGDTAVTFNHMLDEFQQTIGTMIDASAEFVITRHPLKHIGLIPLNPPLLNNINVAI